MKILIAFYSRTMRTERVAQQINNALEGSTLIKIRTPKRVGFLRGIMDSIKVRDAEIDPISSAVDPRAFDLVIACGPVWASHISSPMRAFLRKHSQGVRAFAFVETHGASKGDFPEVFKEMGELTGQTPAATLSLMPTAPDSGDQVNAFIEEIRKLG